MKRVNGKQFLSDLKLYSDFLKWDEDLGRYETWNEGVDKVLNTHTTKYGDKVQPYLDEIRPSFYKKEFLSSQRNLQYRGEQILKHNVRLYNCCTTYAYSPDVFNKGFYVLLCGAGLGVSLRKKFIEQLPPIIKKDNPENVLFVVEDSIEGWADSAKALVSSYCLHPSLDESYFGKNIIYDFSKIRPKGAFISGGFRAPGPDGLRQSLARIDALLGANAGDFKSIVAYDVFMHLSDAVLSGGVRRSAMNVVVDHDDLDMIYAKTGDWYTKTPWRGRSNNSVGLIRDTFSKEQFNKLVELNQGTSDIGFVFTNSEDEIFNPCFTKSQRILTTDGWRSFEDLLNVGEFSIVQDNRVKGKLENGKEVWDFDLDKTGTTTNIVTKVAKTGELKDIYKLTTTCGREVEATGDHSFATPYGMTNLLDLKIGDSILCPIPDMSVSSDIWDTDYMIGFLSGMIIGDGFYSNGASHIEIWEQQESTLEIRSYIEKSAAILLGSLYKDTMYPRTSLSPVFNEILRTDAYVKYRLYSKPLMTVLQNYGFKDKQNFEFILSSNTQYKAGIISGLFYSDGHVEWNLNKKDISLRITQSNKELLTVVQLVLQELGIRANLYLGLPKRTVKFKKDLIYYNCKESFRLSVPGVNNTKNFIKILHPSCPKVQFANSILVTLRGYKKIRNLATIESISYIGKEDVYCLEENNNRTLIVEGLTARRCFEINFSFYNQVKDKTKAAFQLCNLNEINASATVDSKGNFSEETFYRQCRNAAILGTLQAGYTSFPYLGKQTEDIVAGEALLGVSITGWMSRPELFNPEILQRGASIVLETNAEVANHIGINLSARTTTVKPSGNASVILQTSSGIHPEHSLRYFRIMQLNKDSEVARYLEEHQPDCLEDSKWSATNSDYVVYVPCENQEGVITKAEMQGIKHLDLIKLVQHNWVLPGTRVEKCFEPETRHNVSNTVIIDDMDAIVDYLFQNQKEFTAVSFISLMGDKDYVQAPFTSVLDTEKLVATYGDAVIFMAGLIVDGLHYFNDDLWTAVSYVKDDTKPLVGTRSQVMLQKDWIRRVKKFSKNYFKGDIDTTLYCMKDVHLWHKWNLVVRNFKPVDFVDILTKPNYADVSNYAALSCHGGACEL